MLDFFQILFLYQLTQELYPDDIYFLIYMSSESQLPMEFKSFYSIVGLGFLFVLLMSFVWVIGQLSLFW